MRVLYYLVSTVMLTIMLSFPCTPVFAAEGESNYVTKSSTADAPEGTLVQRLQWTDPEYKAEHCAEIWSADTKSVQKAIWLWIDGKRMERINPFTYLFARMSIHSEGYSQSPNLFMYYGNVGSGGTTGLSIYSYSEDGWKKVFTDPNEDKVNHNLERLRVSAIAPQTIRITDLVTGISGIYKSNLLIKKDETKIRLFRLDPVCEYRVHESGCIGHRIAAIQFFYFDLPGGQREDITLQSTYSFHQPQGKYVLWKTEIRDPKGNLVGRKTYDHL